MKPEQIKILEALRDEFSNRNYCRFDAIDAALAKLKKPEPEPEKTTLEHLKLIREKTVKRRNEISSVRVIQFLDARTKALDEAVRLLNKQAHNPPYDAPEPATEEQIQDRAQKRADKFWAVTGYSLNAAQESTMLNAGFYLTKLHNGYSTWERVLDGKHFQLAFLCDQVVKPDDLALRLVQYTSFLNQLGKNSAI